MKEHWIKTGLLLGFEVKFIVQNLTFVAGKTTLLTRTGHVKKKKQLSVLFYLFIHLIRTGHNNEHLQHL